MKLLLQWSLATPQDWQTIDLTSTGKGQRAWRDLPRKPVPTGGETINNTPGWLFDVCVQGVQLGGYDHYAAEPVTDPTHGQGVRVTVWNDDPQDWPASAFHANVWEFFDPAPDARFGGRVNTRQRASKFVGPDAPMADLFGQGETSLGPVVWRTWAQFSPPASQITSHGIWLSDALNQAHIARRSVPDWKGWV